MVERPAAENGQHAAGAPSEADVLTLEAARVQVDRLKEQLRLLDERRDRHIKSKPSVIENSHLDRHLPACLPGCLPA